MAKRTNRRTTSTSVSMTPPAGRGTEFNPDYSYVKKDLMKIGTLAGSFFVILIVLSFFLR